LRVMPFQDVLQECFFFGILPVSSRIEEQEKNALFGVSDEIAGVGA
jgi:hypothetical protein